ncbi:uncharacterized protein LOC122847813 [Aphidius gifuensis]|uniref:uncharacterized protein LOC122847813 n=1 Tax=Aphidius gifuensis TaxID=684658 RepID=UPI001CDB719B|nr:uncharacterized protein LOC122847813 [Aphidius gifuensis]
MHGLYKSVPELNIPKLQPYQVESGIYTFEISEITAKINVENVILHGLEKLVFQSVKPNHGNDYFSLDFVFTISDVFVEGDYKASGALGSYRHSGQGKFNITVQDMEAMVHLYGPVDTNDIWSIEEFHFKPEFGNMKFWASNIFKGNKDLTEAMLNLINSYWRNFVDGMMPLAEKNWNKSLAKITNDGLKNIKFSDIFP